MERIEALGLASRLSPLTQPVLGVCLGMQLLFERSEEEGIACLGLVPGQVRKLAPAPRRPVPHMGWSKLSVGSAEPGLGDGDYVYFAHRDRKSTRLNSSHSCASRMPSSA